MIGSYGAGIPQVTKNLLIINVLFFIGKYAFASGLQIDLGMTLSAFYPDSNYFKPWQVLTHMFMHADLTHILFNMFSLWMFGGTVERVLGGKRFLVLYFFSGLGAYSLYTFYHYYEAQTIIAELPIAGITLEDIKALAYGRIFNEQQQLRELSIIYTVPMMGASGAIYGILVAFGMLFPEARLMLLFPPIPMKAKWFIPIMILIELFQQIQSNPQDNIAHLAHLGGALFGFLVIRHWKKTRLV